MTIASTEPAAVDAIDDMLRLCKLVRHAKPRDPLRMLEDTLLDMRHEVQAGDAE